nr:MAG TPA: hypothetical protein [Caudoviricetes sp.]
MVLLYHSFSEKSILFSKIPRKIFQKTRICSIMFL